MHDPYSYCMHMQGIGGIRRPIGGVGYQTIEFRAPFEKLPGEKRKGNVFS